MTISVEDYETARQIVWTDQGNYIVADKTHNHVGAHRLILERKLGRALLPGEMPDHINGDRTDNRRCNLRPAFAWQNTSNRSKAASNKSGFKGVAPEKQTGKWKASITYRGQSITIGRFTDKLEAAWMYDQWALCIQGEFAVTNFLYK